jgi:hypothetical protein
MESSTKKIAVGSVQAIHAMLSMAYSSSLSMILSENRYPLCANAVLRVGIMLGPQTLPSAKPRAM